MKIPPEIKKAILESDNKALATSGKDGLNVVPVSTIFIKREKIILVNYFFNKTAENVMANPKVSLVCWKGFQGYQIKGMCQYLTDEKILFPVKKWAAVKFPQRTVTAILSISPEMIYEVAAKENSGKLIWSS